MLNLPCSLLSFLDYFFFAKKNLSTKREEGRFKIVAFAGYEMLVIKMCSSFFYILFTIIDDKNKCVINSLNEKLNEFMF